jgi:hypothetical protein
MLYAKRIYTTIFYNFVTIVGLNLEEANSNESKNR